MSPASDKSLASHDVKAVASDPKPGWIDAHVHLWTSDTQKYPIHKQFTVEDMQPRSFTPSELFAHCTPVGVNRAVLIQMSFYGFDNRYLLDTIAAHPRVFSGVGVVDHHAPDVTRVMKKLVDKGIRGFRLYAPEHESAGWLKDDGMELVWATARELGLVICPLVNPTGLPHLEALCSKFPGTPVVIDHFARIGMSGNFDSEQLKALYRLGRFSDVHLKASAYYALGRKEPPYEDLIPMVRRVVDAFGPNRLMWGSDCPYQVQGGHTYADSIALIRDHIDFLTKADKWAILRGTAERVFFS